MRRMLGWILVFCLLAVGAAAETRERVIILEGQEETVTETLYASGLGFSFWYDADLLAVTADGAVDEGFGEGVELTSADGSDLITLDLMLPPATGWDSAWEYLENNAEDETLIYEDLESGLELIHCMVPMASETEDLVRGIYVVTDQASGAWLGGMSFLPAEAQEGAGVRLLELMRTVSFGTAPAGAPAAGDPETQSALPIRVAWAKDAMDAQTSYLSWRLTADTETWVLFTATEEITDFSLCELTMQFQDGGDFTFHEAEVFHVETLWPARPLIAGLDFPGDFPAWGIVFVDASGTEHHCAVIMSGEDGSLLLDPY